MREDQARQGITRRRALALGAAGGVSGLLLRAGVPSTAAAAAGGLRSVGLTLPAGAVPGAGRPGVVVRARSSFDLVGLRGVDLRGAHAELRVRTLGGSWSPWVPLGPGVDHAPDAPSAAPASDPIWAGGADELQLRARRALRGGRLQLITVPASAVPARSAFRAAPSTGGAGPRQAPAAAPVIISRAEWGAAAVPPRAAASYGTVSLAFVHHTVSANTYTPADSPRIVLSIAKYHRDSNGWNDIGYNFLVDRFGQVFEGRAGGIDQAVIGAQAGGWNSQSTGIATIGDYGATPLPEASMAVLTRLIAWKLTLHAVPLAGTVQLVSGGGKENRYPYGQKVLLHRVSGHRDGCTTECPGNVLYGQLDDLRARVAAAGPTTGTTAAARATLTAAASRVAFGQDAVLSGQVLRPDGSAAADVPVSIQKKTKAGGWARVATARTNASGAFETRVAWKRAAPLRAQAQLAPGAAGRVRSTEVNVALDGVLTVTAPGEKSRVLAGGKVAMAGTVGPSAPVTVLIARQDRSGRWVDAGTCNAAVTKTAFTASVPLAKPALYRLTAVTGSPGRVQASPVFVRAVRTAAGLSGGQGGAVAPPVS